MEGAIMIKAKRIVHIFFSIFLFSSNCLAEIQLTNTLAKDIGRAYGFYLGQNHSLSEISKKYPSLSRSALIAEKEFYLTFKSSVDGMDSLMSKHSKTEWKKIKNNIISNIGNAIDIDQITKSQSIKFIELVRKRATGDIESPILETLLIFKDDYQEQPEKEFLDGYTYKYKSNGSGKAKNVAFSIEVPKTWLAKEAGSTHQISTIVHYNFREIIGCKVQHL